MYTVQFIFLRTTKVVYCRHVTVIGLDVCAGDVIDAAMTEPASRDHDSDVIKTRPLLTPCEFVIKVEAGDDEDADIGLDRVAAEQRRSSGGDVAADDDGDCTERIVKADVDQRLHATVDIADNDDDERDFATDMASEATSAAVKVLSDKRPSSPADDTTPADRNTPPVNYQQQINVGRCRVCGDEATGMYFGALVCVPCKVNRNFETSLSNHCCMC